MVITRKTETELKDALTALGVDHVVAERLSRHAPEVAEMLLAEAAGDDTRADALLAEIKADWSEGARHLREDLHRQMKDMGRPSNILLMREGFAAEAMAKATTDEERAEIKADGDDRSLTYAFSVVFRPDPDEDPSRFCVRVPALPGCNTYGEDMVDARQMAETVIRLYLLTLIKGDEPIPGDNTVDTRTGATTITPEPGQTVEVIMVTVEVPVAQ